MKSPEILKVRIGKDLVIGDPSHIVIQTMCNTHTDDVDATVAQCKALAAAGAIASFAITEATHQAISEGAPRVVGKIVEKEWITGENARASHLAMNGERVPIDADFSNGQHWPGEDIGDPEESCGCNCTTEVVISSK